MSDSPPRLALWIGAGVAVVLAAIAVLVAVSPDADDPTRAPAPSIEASTELLPAPWPPQPEAAEVVVGLDAERGPSFRRGDQVIWPTPSAAGADASWETTTHGGRTTITGTSTVADTAATTTWTLAEHNPQALWTLEAPAVPLARLSQPVVLEARLPCASLEAIGRDLRRRPLQESAVFGGWDPIWIRCQTDAGPLVISQVAADGLTVEPTDDGALVRLLLWDPSAHPEAAACAEAAGDDATAQLAARMVLTVGEAAPAGLWPFAHGQAGALVPVFDLPRAHADALLHEAGATDVDDWLERARTLIYGHSEPTDPRYGNGGLLGHGLGGSLVVPAAWWDAPGVEDLRAQLVGSGVDLVAAAPTPQPELAATARIVREQACQAWRRDAAERRASVIVTGTEPDAAGYRNALSTSTPTRLPPLRGGLPAALRLAELDGQLSTLTGEALSKPYLQSVVRDHGVLALSTPFVATRNPLVGAAPEALLEPERDGQWTVAPRLAGALADIELWREAEPLAVVGLHRLISYRRAADRIALWWTPDARLDVAIEGQPAAPGLTVVVPATEAPATFATASTYWRPAGDLALVWSKQPPKSDRVTLPDAAIAGPAPVRWKLVD